MNEGIAKFRMLNFVVDKSFINIKQRSNLDCNLNVDFSSISNVKESECIYKLTLELSICTVDENIEIKLTSTSSFEFSKDLTEEEKKSFFGLNAPALMFPYVRAYITTLTSLSGIPPVILPTLNLTNILNK